MVTRRALLGAGAVLVAGCGSNEPPSSPVRELLGERLRDQQASLAAYEGVPGAGPLRARASTMVARLTDAVRAAGGTPPAAPSAPSPPRLAAALRAEQRALRGQVAAVGLTQDARTRALLAELIADTAAREAALQRLLHGDPLATAFPGEPA